MNKYFLIFCIIIASINVFAQDTQLGSKNLGVQNYQGGFYDYSDPEAINIKVSIWGFVSYPGKYLVPSYSTLTDLISYAGGPSDRAELDEIRLYRIVDGKEQFIKANLEDLLWEDNLEFRNRNLPDIEPGDVLIVPGSERLYFSNYLTIGLSIFSAMISLAILILNINSN